MDATLATIKNSDSVYFPDGDIVILSLPKNNVITAFKVDRIFLRRSCRNSETGTSSIIDTPFKRLTFDADLASPPSGKAEFHDNVPLIKLQDEADHLTVFLKALYDKSSRLGQTLTLCYPDE
ncbi:hypothetical protein Clacol_007906 [Clathrus columnatus]|uniref:Uncharacterized protein n=1 Tax=Clathrus columnatus TaxID=1419009 RepID=A0AAV5AH17_9AGAM|nr:hypothetical protein Clacol_007906 [Clathrus columnatus]